LQAVIIALEEGSYQAALEVLTSHGPPPYQVKMLVGAPNPGPHSLIDLNFRK
jgi:hypothetical protein